jgi:putative colanic acid biosynthesis acetyltransferase WcaB
MTLLKEQCAISDNGKDSINRVGNPLFWEVVRQDRRANRMSAKAQLVLFAFRLAHVFATGKDTNRILWIAGLPILILYRILVEWTLCIELPAKTDIGAGLRLFHGQALVVNAHARIGSDCTLRHCTTIGSKVLASGEERPSPALGDRVDVGSNVVILGGISIGDDVVVGAGSVVIRDVADGAVVAGNPARVLYYR